MACKAASGLAWTALFKTWGVLSNSAGVVVRICEVSGTYKTADTPANHFGIHVLNKTKVCTWTHGERDGNLTGHGSNAVRECAFLHMVSGLIECIEEVLCPHTDGFFKHFDLTISPDEPSNYEFHLASDSRVLLRIPFHLALEEQL